ncbi:hypothetical protein [Marinicella meishanensis]|uniref:hypothetical protein n=1 Tax=Marinicella meishanensis TaxID=2873263 RepID=UPI001CC0A289|nr:hypothetical protein [Marinicella sp. NBU2979]
MAKELPGMLAQPKYAAPVFSHQLMARTTFTWPLTCCTRKNSIALSMTPSVFGNELTGPILLIVTGHGTSCSPLSVARTEVADAAMVSASASDNTAFAWCKNLRLCWLFWAEAGEITAPRIKHWMINQETNTFILTSTIFAMIKPGVCEPI